MAATTEKLMLFAGGGDDHIHADQITPAVALSLDGGAGHDHITGGAGRDNVKGGLDKDNVGGGDGDDLVSGELAFGDRGNDRITVEGSVKGIAEGGDGVDVAYVGTGAAADTVSVRPSPPNVRVDGQAGDAPFAVSVRNSEALYVDTGDGDDSATIAPGTGALISTLLRGGRGNDTLRGSDGLRRWPATSAPTRSTAGSPRTACSAAMTTTRSSPATARTTRSSAARASTACSPTSSRRTGSRTARRASGSAARRPRRPGSPRRASVSPAS